MALEAGTRLGHYEIIGSLGAGGMGEVYVTPFPGPGRRVQVSNSGGDYAVWSETSPELFYRSIDLDSLVVVRYTVEGETFTAEKPEIWSETRFLQVATFRPFTLHPDGERFAILQSSDDEGETNHVTFVLNFFDELERLAPTR